MVFTEPSFLFLFLPLMLFPHLILPSGSRNALLLAGSLVFYGVGEKYFVFLLVVSCLVNYGLALWLQRARFPLWKKIILGVGIAGNLGALALFKYAGFAIESINRIATALGVSVLDVPNIGMPLGISFFTFKSLSYLIDVYRGGIAAERNPINMGLYISFFPQLMAGPIVRYHEMADRLANRAVAGEEFAYGIRRFIVGLGKKLIIADTLAAAADGVFGVPNDELTLSLAWWGSLCYTLQIYYDFSGYSDMAIGMGYLFGFRTPENFNYPYLSRSLTEFWRRWHMTLSSWFRDYLYIPLGGNRSGSVRTYINLVIVFLLCGLWHGAHWNFVLWGSIHGLVLVMERLGGIGRNEGSDILGSLRTMFVVVVAWVFFRADSIGQAVGLLSTMFGFHQAQESGYTVRAFADPVTVVMFVVGLLGAMDVFGKIRLMRIAAWSNRLGLYQASLYRTLELLSLLVVFFWSLSLSAAGTHDPFIYFRF